MEPCRSIPQIHLLHDGELSPGAQHELQTHLAACEECAAELAELRLLVKEFAQLQAETERASRLSMIERARLERRLEQAFAEQNSDNGDAQWIELARTARMLSAIAASILIISSIWLIEIPSGHTTVVSPAVVAVSPRDSASPAGVDHDNLRYAAATPDWERIALTLRVDPRPEDASAFDVGVADARSFSDNSPDGPVADWIIAELGSGSAHANP